MQPQITHNSNLKATAGEVLRKKILIKKILRKKIRKLVQKLFTVFLHRQDKSPKQTAALPSKV